MLPVNQNLSNFSDLMVQTAFVIYALALVLSLVYYGRVHAVAQARASARSAQELPARHAVAVGATTGDAPVLEHPREGEDAEAAAAEDYSALVGRADRLGGVVQSVMWVGIAVHIAAVVLRGLATGRFPFGNLYEYVLMVTAATLAISSFFLSRKEWRVLWPWLLVPVMALMFYGSTVLYAESAPVVPALQSHWLPIHVTVVSLGAAIGIVSGLVSLLHVLRRAHPKGAEGSSLWGWIARPLPSAKKLDQLAYRTGVVTLPVLGLGIVLGAMWAEVAWGRPWGWDPKETVSLATWVLYAAYLHARATPSFRKAAPWINIIALATMIFNLFFINQVVSGLHSYAGLN